MIAKTNYKLIDGNLSKNLDKILHNPKKEGLYAFMDDGNIYDNLFHQIVENSINGELYLNVSFFDDKKEYPLQIIALNQDRTPNKENIFTGQILVIALYSAGQGIIDCVELKRNENYTKMVQRKDFIKPVERDSNQIVISHIILNFLLQFI